MKNAIINYLTNLGYTNITFNDVRKGLYIMAQNYNATICIDLRELCNEILRKEIQESA